MELRTVDVAMVALYLAALVSIGLAMKRRAARGSESYLLGERRLPWSALTMSGSSSYFDIIGTMWIVSLFVVLGLRGMWVQWIWGFVIPAFYAAYMGRWPRPSRVMTGSEWMVFRFGAGRSGDANRLAYTVYAVLTVTVFLALAPRLPRTRRMTIRTPMIIRPRKITQRPDHLGMVERTARYSASNHLAIDHSGAHRGSFGKTRRFQHNLMKSTKRSHLVDMSNNALREPEVGCFWGC